MREGGGRGDLIQVCSDKEHMMPVSCVCGRGGEGGGT